LKARKNGWRHTSWISGELISRTLVWVDSDWSIVVAKVASMTMLARENARVRMRQVVAVQSWTAGCDTGRLEA